MAIWGNGHGALIWWGAGVSAASFVIALVTVRVFVVRIPPDYFVVDRREAAPAADRHAIRRALPRLGKNLLGCTLIAAGLAMLVLPGQGVLTILVGVMLLDFPGKLRLGRWMVARRPVHQSINWLRRRAGRAPLVLWG
jgi:hypothetical protein